MISVEHRAGSTHIVRAPQPGRREFGVPPGGPWDREAWSLVAWLGGADSQWELATLGSCVFARLTAHQAVRVAVAGGPGRLMVGRQSALLPAVAFLGPGESAEMETTEGHRFWVGAGPGTLGPSWVRGISLSLDAVIDQPFKVVDAAPGLPASAVIGLDSSRMGLRLKTELSGPPASRHSEPCTFGSLQWTPDGSLILHGPEGPTTGGYGLAGWLPGVEAARLSRLRPGTLVRFSAISEAEAGALQKAWLEKQDGLKLMVERMRERGLV